jgi:hypothetical protein
VIASLSATARKPLSQRHCIVFDTIDNDNVVASFGYPAKDSSERGTGFMQENESGAD